MHLQCDLESSDDDNEYVTKLKGQDFGPEIEVFSPNNKSQSQHTVMLHQNESTYRICFQIKIRDTGRGITKSGMDKLFNNFHKLEGKSNPTGTGLGLSICKQLVQKMNGTIKVKSTVNKGSVFLIELHSLCHIGANPEVQQQ